jgi:membrane-bound metal-dependent hydrolase YbcI (DUF457 family)
MPSPVGHALGGLAAGWMIAGLSPSRFGAAADGEARRARVAPVAWHRSEPVLRQAIVFAALGMLPDIDFLFGTHSTYTHSLGAAVVVALGAAMLAPANRWIVGLACGCAYASHILLDWLGDDTTPPIGIMAVWPWSSGFYQSDLRWFMAITRRYWLPNFWTHNMEAVIREVGILLPLAAFIAWLRRPVKRSPVMRETGQRTLRPSKHPAHPAERGRAARDGAERDQA